MKQKSSLFSTAPVIQHSLATPLTNILLNTEIAVKNLDQTPQQVELYLKRVLLNAQYLKDALKLAETNKNQAFYPQTALEELMVLNQGSKLKQHLVSRIFLPQPIKLLGNKLAFQEMVVCLLNNAYESYQTQKQRLVFLSATLRDKELIISVTDGGRGMNWLTKKFSTSQLYSTKANHSGLGLYFVKNTLEKDFAGKFVLRSKPHRGTTISLSFPLKSHQSVTKTSPSLDY